jgi:hypothetical protein
LSLSRELKGEASYVKVVEDALRINRIDRGTDVFYYTRARARRTQISMPQQLI